MKDRLGKGQKNSILPPPWGTAGPLLTGWTVLLILMVLVLLEYVAAIYMDRNLPLMVAMNVIDAGLIMYYFMHVARLWRRREE